MGLDAERGENRAVLPPQNGGRLPERSPPDVNELARRIFVNGEVAGDRLWHDLAIIQQQSPVLFCPEADVWIATGFSEVRAILSARGAQVAFAARNDRMTPGWREHRSRTDMAAWFGHKDGAEHMRTRKALNSFFMPAAMRALGVHLDAVVPQIVSDFKARGGGDFLDLVGFELTAHVTDHLLGLEQASRPDFRHLIPKIMKTFDFNLTDEEWRDADDASDEMRGFWRRRISERLVDPSGDDVLGQIIRSEIFDGDELVVIGENIIAAGSDTTAHSATNGMALLLRNPDVMTQLRSDAALRGPVVDEVLRLVAAAPISGRGLAEPLDLNGQLIPQDAVVLAVIGAANRDPSQFEHPYDMDVTRTNAAKAVPFGHGLHICLGQWVVREALMRLYPEMLRQCSTIEVEGEIPEFKGLGIRHVSGLDLRVA